LYTLAKKIFTTNLKFQNMKKMFFTTIAVLVFVGASMAKTSEVGTNFTPIEIKTDKISVTNVSEDDMNSCLAAGETAYAVLRMVMDDDAALDAAIRVEDACLESRGD
jgi:hypothetical protein